MMKALISLTFSFLLMESAHALMIISDVDDTVKITNSGSTLGSTWSGLFKKSAFVGMPAVYRAWDAEKAKIYFVTGSPTIVGKNMHAMMNANNIPYISITFRSNQSEETYKYKMRAVSRLMDRHPEEQVVLLGDNVNSDFDVYRDIAAKYPGRVLATYIHHVKNRASLEGQIPWVTAYDIAVTEGEQGRVKALLATAVKDAVIKGDKSKLFPSYAWCPKDLSNTGLPTENTTDAHGAQVKKYVETLCQNRGK